MEKLLSAKHVADFLGMHPKTLYKAIRENRIALNFVRPYGRTIAFRPKDVEIFLSLREVNRTGDGIRKRRKQTVAEHTIQSIKRTHKIREIMTDEEAQTFFDGLPQDEDGNIILGHPDGRDE